MDSAKQIVGFDLVTEEDYSPPISDFLELLLKAKKELGRDKFDLFLHAGESVSRDNTEMYDAVLLGCKRIGHGFALIKHPSLINIVKKKEVCLEVCPWSNLCLGYVHDMRTHPARQLLTKGIKCSINPDD